MSYGKISNVEKTTDNKCKKIYLFINIYGTIEFLLSSYLLKNSNDKEVKKVILEYKKFVSNYCIFVKKCMVFNGCYLGSGKKPKTFSEKVDKFLEFKNNINNIIIKKENSTLRKYITLIELIIKSKDKKQFKHKFTDLEYSLERYDAFLKDVESNKQRPFMIGFSLIQSLLLFSPYFAYFKILTAHEWNIKKNNYFIKTLKQSINEKQCAYLMLPCYLRIKDCINNNEFRVTVHEIGSIIKEGYEITEIFPNNKSTTVNISKRRTIPWNYPELFRFFRITRGSDIFNLPSRIKLPESVYKIIQEKLKNQRADELLELYGFIWLKKIKILKENETGKLLSLDGRY